MLQPCGGHHSNIHHLVEAEVLSNLNSRQLTEERFLLCYVKHIKLPTSSTAKHYLWKNQDLVCSMNFTFILSGEVKIWSVGKITNLLEYLVELWIYGRSHCTSAETMRRLLKQHCHYYMFSWRGYNYCPEKHIVWPKHYITKQCSVGLLW